ncbi:MAG: alpha/beta hydrolase [Clostridium sp.]|nr:alpha/beta hydrolase [Clostridium sp.]
MKYVILIILGLLLVVILLLVSTSIRYVNRVLYPKTKNPQKAKQRVLEQGYYPEEYINSLSFDELSINSPYGYILKGRIYPNDSNKYVIIVHGISMNIFGSLKYLSFFHKKGFNVVVFNLRNHGDSGGHNTTYGHFEKWDLRAVTDHLFKTYGKDIHVGLHGESMGGTIAMLNMAMDERIEFGVVDSAFSDLPELLLLKFKQDTGIESKKIIAFLNLIVKIRSGFTIEDVSPLKELPAISQPILFIHGDEDTYIPMKMTKAMYAFKMDKKVLYIAEGGVHGTAMGVNPDRYDEELTNFLNIVYPNEDFKLGH